jgi:hypothetical protein
MFRISISTKMIASVKENNRGALFLAFVTWAKEPPLKTKNHRASRPLPQALSRQDIADFAFGVARGEFAGKTEARYVRDQGRELRAAIRDPGAVRDRDEAALRLSMYLAGVYIPAMAALKRYDRAVRMTRCFLKRLRADHHAAVRGAGNAGYDPARKYALLGPVLAALAVYHP